MAERKLPSEVPASPGNCKNDLDGAPSVEPLPAQQFDNVIRAINLTAGAATVQQLQVKFAAELLRLRVRQRPRLGLTSVPSGSDNIDPQSLYRWAEKVQRTDGSAVAQVQLIHATAARRLGMG